MRVLLVNSKYPPEYAGSALRAHNTYVRLVRKFGLQVKVVAGSVAFREPAEYELDGIPVKRIVNSRTPAPEPGSGAGPGARILARARRKLVAFRNYLCEALPTLAYLARNHRWFDLLHVVGNVNVTSAAILYSKITRKPVMIELVNLVQDPNPYVPLPIALAVGKGFPGHARIVCISENLRQVCRDHGYQDRNIWCRPNPVDEARFNFEPGDRAARRERIGLGRARGNLILHLAKFMPLKNQVFLIDVLRLLPEDFHLLLAGPLVDSGPLRDRDQGYFRALQEKIASAGLGERAHVRPGFVDRPEEYIKSADVFVLPSIQEALGTPVLESLACGVPVVANRIPGVFDRWIRDGEDGFIRPLEAGPWAEALRAAVGFGPEAMRRASARILGAASTAAIDEEYYARFGTLVREREAT